jgi:hypothetical protein
MDPIENKFTPPSSSGDVAAGIERARRVMALTGYVMLVISSFLLFAMLYRGFIGERKVPPAPDKDTVFVWFMQYYSWETFVTIGVVLLVAVGLRLLGAAGKTTPRAIPAEDRELLEPLVQSANKDAIEQYVILSSLSGFTGTFQKIGFSGLPLATVTLTLVFCILSFVKPEFIEFAKLTLGAFIGSFVQRGSDAPKLPSIKWEK